MAGRRKSALSRTSTPNGNKNEDVNDPYSSSFDPASFKVVQLRALLVEHEVAFPSAARKADLIQAYEDNIRPRLDELRAARNRDRNIRPKVEDVTVYSNGNGHATSTSGSEKDVESSGNESESQLPPSALSHPGTSRRGQRSVSWAGDVSGPEDEEPDADASTFSVNNPFQSPRLTPESKPAPSKAARKSEPAQKRQSSEKRPRSSLAGTMRDYMDPNVASNISPRTIGNATSKVKSRLSGLGHVKPENKGDDSGMEGDISRDADDDSLSSPPSQKRKRSSQLRSKLSQHEDEVDGDDKVKAARSVVWMMLAALTVSWWVWYATESRVVGFCDVGRHSNALLDERARVNAIALRGIKDGDENASMNLRVPNILRPSCVACPPHALCQEGALFGCESSDYVLQSSVLAHIPLVGSLAPLSLAAPVCRPDEQKLVLAADLADEVENRLRTWKGHIQCKRETAQFGSLKGPKEEDSDIAYSLPKDLLYEQLREEVGKGSALSSHPPEYFEELWNMALDDLHTTNRIQEEYRGQAILYAKRGATGVGLDCRARLLVESAWQRVKLWLGLSVAALLTGLWLRYKFRSGRIQQGQRKELIASTLTRLEQTKRHSMQGKIEDGFLSISQLRDDILRHESSEANKRKTWLAVVKVVEANTNVRTRQAKVKGEWSRVWEWVGALNGASGSQVKSRPKREENEEAVNMGKERLSSVEV